MMFTPWPAIQAELDYRRETLVAIRRRRRGRAPIRPVEPRPAPTKEQPCLV